MDPRVAKLAKLLVNYSLKVKKGQLVKIQGEAVTLPLITAAYEAVLEAGGHPYTEIAIPENTETFLKKANPDQMEFLSPLRKYETEKMDALLVIWGTNNTKFLTGVDPKRQAAAQKSRSPLMQRLFKRMGNGSLSWVGTQFPTLADAQQAEMSLAEYEDFVYKAGHILSADPTKHWLKMAKEQGRLVKILNRIDRLHIQSGTTDLKMRVKGRKWVSCHGTENFPDGEIFTSPHESSAEGKIQFTYPAVFAGRQVDRACLEFKKGRVVAESAERNQAYLTAMLNMDKGSRLVGEIAIGTNYEIKRATGNTLFDEKIGGSCHLAVGASIPEAGGVNKSALHWDMVCDLKKGGEIRADGKIIYRNGKFVI